MRVNLVVAAMLAGGLILAIVDRSDAEEGRPNILFAIADDWSWPHAGAYGDRCVKTPTFDRIAAEGVLFTHAYCAAPSCTPSRGAIVTGQAPHRLEEGGNLWSLLPKRFEVYPDILERAGYVVGHTRKGWGPGNIEAGGRDRNPAGPQFKDFKTFLAQVPADKPFCFWFGSLDPHRVYEKGSGLKAGLKLEDVVVPGFLPDTPEVRSDILDYYYEVQRFDREVGELLDQIASAGRGDNTLVVMTSDNGMPFPRAKANLYEYGIHMPLAIRWPARVKAGGRVDDFVSFADFAPTFLEVAGLKPLPDMTGRSLLGPMMGESVEGRDCVFVERERHACARVGDMSYPGRAIRTKEFLYIRNLRPKRWPAGDPTIDNYHRCYGDIDASPSKDIIVDGKNDPQIKPFFDLACAKRPAEELYDIKQDPFQLTNLADKPEYAGAKERLRARLDQWMHDTEDPRALSDDDRYDQYPYFGRKQPEEPVKKK